MPVFDIFDASVLVGDVELPEYNVIIDNNTKTVTCWIPSEAGKAFSIRWKLLSPSPDVTSSDVSVDGSNVGGIFVRENKTAVSVLSDVHITPTTTRSLMFSDLELTDDDALLHVGNAKDLGDIRLDLHSASLGKIGVHRPATLPTADTKVHEKVKKGMAHRVNFGEEKSVPRANFCEITRLDRKATFIFKYRSIDILRADGIVPPDPASLKSGAHKRKLDIMDNEKEETDGDDGEEESAEAELKVLLERANRIQSLLAKKARKSKSKNRKKVKTEHRPLVISGEVIDLT